MISSFAAYLLLVSVFFAGGAWATEQAFIVRRWPRRFLWLTVMAASVLFPLAMALHVSPAPWAPPRAPDPQTVYPVHTPPPVPVQEPAPALVRPAARPAAPELASVRPADVRRPARPSLDQLVSILWLSSSLATALWYLLAGVRLSRLVRRAPSATVQGVAVRLSPAGPAVFGVFRPAILWPHWLGEAPAATQAAAIAHEQQHLAAGDPLVLAAGLFMVVLAPWNPALWWQLQRMRFALEADCDQRVVLGGTESQSYALALLHIAERRPPWNTRLAMLMSAPSWLERRVGTLLYAPGRLRRWTTLAVPLALAALAAAGELPVPSLHDAELRLLPPEDTTPGADWARAIARSRYPELFDRHFEGTAVVAAMFTSDGKLKLVEKHEFAPGVAPSDFGMQIENKRAGIDLTDVLYLGAETGSTIGPWLETVNQGRVFVVYEVLKWEPDPARRVDHARAALQAAEPQLYSLYTAGVSWDKQPRMQLALFMNDDGSLAQIDRRNVPEETAEMFTDPEAVAERFAAMGIPKERLGRAEWFGLGHLDAVAAWSKRPDDPPDAWDLSFWETSTREIARTHPPRVDVQDEERIETRYFHDLQMHGPEAITEVVAGQTTLRMPWVLVGPDGQVWDAGFWHSNSQRPVVARALAYELLARFPGIGLASEGFSDWHTINGVPVVTVWISADSPIRRKSDIDVQERKDILVTGGMAGVCVFAQQQQREIWAKSLGSEANCGSQYHLGPQRKGVRQAAFVPFAAAADLGTPAIIDLSGPPENMTFYAPVVKSAEQAGGQDVPLGAPSDHAESFELTVTQTTRESVKMHLRTLPLHYGPYDNAEPSGPSRTVDIEAPYGQAIPVELPGDTPDQKARLLLRVERLKP